jgi:uncharacterized protein YqgQ
MLTVCHMQSIYRLRQTRLNYLIVCDLNLLSLSSQIFDLSNFSGLFFMHEQFHDYSMIKYQLSRLYRDKICLNACERWIEKSRI